jgi:tetratricopeptide (TPR) repeat protein
MSVFSQTAPDREQRLDEAIASYLRCEGDGRRPDPAVWIERYPDLADALGEFFADRMRLDQLVKPPEGAHPPKVVELQEANASAPDTVDFAAPRWRPPVGRYQLIQFHARGGMGEVWQAEDLQIGRRVALKRLRPERDEQTPRFVFEARVTGRLEHPSIVPLHDMGIDENGKPFYVMKFVNGRSLKDVIAAYHTADPTDVTPREVQFRRLVETFINVCRAVAYAHSQGVLHRDVKPDNVMLGSYGETLLLDWGLAKAIDFSESNRGSTARVKIENPTDTQHGSVLGSPAYMSPESAQGLADIVDQRSDVFLLGATLYEILTGRPPREGRSQLELVDLARTTLPPSPRSIAPEVPPTLDAICLKAIAYRKQDRYLSPAELAEDLERYLADEPTSAYREPWTARAWRRMRRHRKAIGRGSVAVATAALALIAVGQHRTASQLARQAEVRQQVAKFRHVADEAFFYAANTDVITERAPYYRPDRALSLARAGLALVDALPRQESDLVPVDELAAIHDERRRLVRLAARLAVEGREDTTSLRDMLTILEHADAATQGDYQLRATILTRLGDVASAQRMIQHAKDPRTRQSADDYFLEGELLRIQRPTVSLQPDNMLNSLSRQESLALAIECYRQSLNLDPRHYWAQFQLGRSYLALGRYSESIEVLGACVALRPDAPWAYSVRGLARGMAAQYRDAHHDFEKALALDPQFQPARLNRGVVYWMEGKTKDAVRDFDAVLETPVERRLPEAAFYRAQVHVENGRESEALLDLNALAAESPTFRRLYEIRARVHFERGDDLAGRNDIDMFCALESDQAFDPDSAGAHQARCHVLRHISTSLRPATRTRILQHAINDLKQVLGRAPNQDALLAELGAMYDLLGDASEATKWYSAAIESRPQDLQLRNQHGWAYASLSQTDRVLADFAEVVRQAPENSEAHAGQGFVYALHGDSREARRWTATAMLHGEKNYLVLHNIACIYAVLSQNEKSAKSECEDLALTCLKRSVELWRQSHGGPNELELIRQEPAFRPSLTDRPEFQELLKNVKLYRGLIHPQFGAARTRAWARAASA